MLNRCVRASAAQRKYTIDETKKRTNNMIKRKETLDIEKNESMYFSILVNE